MPSGLKVQPAIRSPARTANPVPISRAFAGLFQIDRMSIPPL
jgi:hypothetical protein